MSIMYTPAIDYLKAAILNGHDPDATEGIKNINETIEYLEQQAHNLRRYADFIKRTSETYTIPAHVAAWLELAIEREPFGNKAPLQYVNVRECNDRTWLAATDGYRLHAHVTDLPSGVYLMVDNKLRQVDSKFPDWTEAMPKATEPAQVSEYYLAAAYDSAAWNIDGNTLTQFDPKRIYRIRENYRLCERYFKDALSLGGEPAFALAETTEKQPEPYQRRMVIAWPDAFAVIMPMTPER